MKIDLSQFRDAFMQESEEHIVSMEAGLFALRSRPDDAETLNAVFRAAHSIKGGAGSFGLKTLVRFTHALESLLDRLRSMEFAATEEVISVLLNSVDVLRELLGSDDELAVPHTMQPLLEQLLALTSLEPSSGTSEATATGATTVTPECHGAAIKVERTFSVDCRPAREIFATGTNPIVLLRNLLGLGSVATCQLYMDQLPPLSELDPEKSYLHWTAEITTSAAEEELLEVFEFVEHMVDVKISSLPLPIHPGQQIMSTAQPAKKEELPTDLATVAIDSLNPGKTDERKQNRRSGTTADTSSIRVTTDKIDRLIDLVGELVIAQVMTAQMVDTFTPECLPKLQEAVAALGRNTRELHERVMSVRMLPIGSLFQRYTRIVYDIAQSTGKQVRLETAGDETEIDKSMLELLGDPLTHLIRNAADHGIESPAVRRASGKPEEGLIHLRAFHRASRIVIEITDDGAGIDTSLVRRKAIERGLMTADAQLTEDQLRMLIFEPGFSTREQVSDLSGRGVGMDVVKRNVQQLSGTVTLASELGRGSTVSIELPLTLAILDGLLVRVEDRTLVLPLLSVIETLAPAAAGIVRLAEQGEVIVVREESIPVLRLCRFIALHGNESDTRVNTTGRLLPTTSANGSKEDRHLVVIVEVGSRKIGLVVNELLGQQQVVMKSLEKNLHKVQGLMGATILGDGCVAPILDVASLSEMNLFAIPLSQRPSGAGASIAAH